jgi:hypothetical protein
MKCVICNKSFIKKKWTQKCCSKECSKINENQTLSDYHKTKKYQNYMKEYYKSDNGILLRKKYYQLNKKRLKEYQKEYQHSNNRKEYMKKRRKTKIYKDLQKRWLKTPKGKLNKIFSSHRRRERENNCVHAFTEKEWIEKLITSKGICIGYKRKSHYVGIKNLTLDHIFSIYLANKYFKQTGKKWIYTIDEIQPLCASCNKSKRDKNMIYVKT